MKSISPALLYSFSLLAGCLFLTDTVEAQSPPPATVKQNMHEGDISNPILIGDAFNIDMTGFQPSDITSFSFAFNIKDNDLSKSNTIQFLLSDNPKNAFANNVYLSKVISSFTGGWDPISYSKTFDDTTLGDILTTHLDNTNHTLVYVYLLNGNDNSGGNTDDWSLQNGSNFATLSLNPSATVAATPEPGATALLIGAGVGLFSMIRRRRRR